MDKITWSGVKAANNYWWPKTRWQLLVYVLVSVITWAVAAFFSKSQITMMLASMVLGLTGYLAIFSPVIFAIGKADAYSLTLPVGRRNMALYMVLWGVVLMPAAVIVPQMLLSHVVYNPQEAELGTLDADMGMGISQAVNKVAQNLNFLYVAAASATCLWVVMATHRMRVLKGLAAAYGANVVFGIILSIICMIGGLSQVLEVIANSDVAQESEIKALIASQIVHVLTVGTYVMTPILIIYCVVAVAMAWRSICTRTL